MGDRRKGRLKSERTGRNRRRWLGYSQLTLCEHCFCPLDTRVSLTNDFRHTAKYWYSDKHGNRKRGQATISCAHGLSAEDDRWLWGLLALNAADDDPTINFYVTPNYVFRKLRLTDDKAGGSCYNQFRTVLKRLGGVTYTGDKFYDPIQKLHRSVIFGWLKYNLPKTDDTNRAYRIIFDQQFFEFCMHKGGHLKFDLETYCDLSPAEARAFLLCQKLFHRLTVSPRFDLLDFAVNVLGYDGDQPLKRIKQKTTAVCRALLEREIITLGPGERTVNDIWQRRSKGRFYGRVYKGPYFDRSIVPSRMRDVRDSPLFDILQAIGMTDQQIRFTLDTYSKQAIQLWSDVTLVARAKFGERFFQKNPLAFTFDNLKAARESGRQPPDWYHDVRAAERRESTSAEGQIISELGRALDSHRAQPKDDFSTFLQAEGRQEFLDLVQSTYNLYREEGTDDTEARSEARRYAYNTLRERFNKPRSGRAGLVKAGELLKLVK